MELNPIKPNQTELKLNDYIVLFSYKTPVAVIFRNSDEVWKTNKKWSKTTSKHISAFLRDYGVETLACEVDQKYIDDLIK